jgi:hypothetical protein
MSAESKSTRLHGTFATGGLSTDPLNKFSIGTSNQAAKTSRGILLWYPRRFVLSVKLHVRRSRRSKKRAATVIRKHRERLEATHLSSDRSSSFGLTNLLDDRALRESKFDRASLATQVLNQCRGTNIYILQVFLSRTKLRSQTAFTTHKFNLTVLELYRCQGIYTFRSSYHVSRIGYLLDLSLRQYQLPSQG